MTRMMLILATAALLAGCIYASPPYGCPIACNYNQPLEPGFR